MYVLSLCSIVSIAIIFDRIFYFAKKSKMTRADFMNTLIRKIDRANLKEAIDFCKAVNTPFACVVYRGLSVYGAHEKEITNAMDREIVIETMKLERFVSIEGTIGSTAVYIGLFGTVLGIIRAFNDIAKSGIGGINVVINGISEALVCTAAGLCVAVPAVMAYNYFVKRIDNFITDMELCASEVADLLGRKK